MLITSTNPRLFNFIAGFEGRIPWIYFDSRGYPTIGIGHMLAGDRHATFEQCLGDLRDIHARFRLYVGGASATDAQIKDRLSGLMTTPAGSRTGHTNEYWRSVPPGTPQVKMTESGMIALKRWDLEQRIRGLSAPGRWPGTAMGTLPEGVQIVIVDIAFNAGVSALQHNVQYATFRAAIDHHDFAAAAAHVDAGGLHISRPARNHDRADLLRGTAP